MKLLCGTCSYMYDSDAGDPRPERGAPPGTLFEDLPETWTCPICGTSKEEFVPPEERPMCNRWS